MNRIRSDFRPCTWTHISYGGTKFGARASRGFLQVQRSTPVNERLLLYTSLSRATSLLESNRLTMKEAVAYPTQWRSPNHTPRAGNPMSSWGGNAGSQQSPIITSPTIEKPAIMNPGLELNYFWWASGYHRQRSTNDDCPQELSTVSEAAIPTSRTTSLISG